MRDILYGRATQTKLWFWSSSANRSEHFPLTAVSRITLIISPCLASRASLSSPFSSPHRSHCSAFLSCLSCLLSNSEPTCMWKYCIAYKRGRMSAYARTSIFRFNHMQVWASAANPNTRTKWPASISVGVPENHRRV